MTYNMTYNMNDISGSNRSLKIPLSLKGINAKKICTNHSKMERDARNRVRALNKYNRTIKRLNARKLKETHNNDLLEWEE